MILISLCPFCHFQFEENDYQINIQQPENMASKRVLDESAETSEPKKAKSIDSEIENESVAKKPNHDDHTSEIHDACVDLDDGDTDEVLKLLEDKENIFLILLNDKRTLHTVTRDGRFRIVQELLKLGLEVNLKDNEGQTPLHAASQNGHVKIVKELLKYGSDINDETEEDTDITVGAATDTKFLMLRAVNLSKSGLNFALTGSMIYLNLEGCYRVLFATF